MPPNLRILVFPGEKHSSESRKATGKIFSGGWRYADGKFPEEHGLQLVSCGTQMTSRCSMLGHHDILNNSQKWLWKE